ncbi:MAG: hypothetical protein H7A21_09725 [Spirochaetales bacterium]|nr:hypothetical protein [Spirochaetales bacterium]
MKRAAWAIVATSVLLYAASALVPILRYENSSALVGFGCLPHGVCFARDNLAVMPADSLVYESGGYDGQFFYYMAASIAGGGETHLDEPRFRRARIGYSLAAAPAFLLGPWALVFAMSFWPLALHFGILAMLVVFFNRTPGFNRERLAALALVALNPFSLRSFVLNVADGFALSLSLAAVLVFMEGRQSQTRRACLVAALLILALLSKETMLAAPFLLCVELFFERRTRSVGAWALALLIPGIAVVLWWAWIGFSPWLAAGRGTVPFAGLVEYLQEPDAFLSGRGLLVPLLFFYFVCGLALCGRAIVSRERALFGPGLALVLIGLVISTGTADEYWGNFANIMRMFTPGVLALFVWAWRRPGTGRWCLVVVSACAAYFLLLDLLMLKADLGSGLLPHRPLEQLLEDAPPGSGT